MSAYATDIATGRTVLIATLTIESAATDSEIVTADQLAQFSGIEIHSANSAHTGTITVEKQSRVNVNDFRTLQSPPGTDVAIAADKVIAITQLGGPGLRLHSSGAEGATRTFYVWGVRTGIDG